jgi:hypothetical protein
MKTKTDYSTLEGDAKRQAAMKDIRKYLGDEFPKVNAKIDEIGETLTLEDMRAICGLFLGIEGYPVRAWFETLRPEAAE